MVKLRSDEDDSQSNKVVDAPVLRDSHVALEAAITSENDDAISEAIRLVEQSVVDRGNAHVQWCEAGKLMLLVNRWDAAQRMAARSLLAYPKYGNAMRVFGNALCGLNRPEEAAACFRFQLPASIIDDHFSDFEYITTTSLTVDDAGLQHYSAFESEHYTLKPPFQTGSVEVPELEYKSMESAKAFVGYVPDGKLWYDGGNAVAWDKRGRLVEDISIGHHRVVHASMQSRDPVKLDGRVCLLGNRSFVNYYHWMCDTLPRLEVLSKSGVDLDSIDHFVMQLPKHDFHLDSLARLGIDEDRLHTTDRGEYIQADELFVPIFGSNSLGLRQGEWSPAFLNRVFGPKTPPAEKGRRLYISRGTTGPRGISNEEQLMGALEPLGFELVRCEDYTLSEQAEMFAAADAVIGPHGAGLTNTVFCRPGTVVLELFNAHIAACFWVISELLNLRHAIQFCGYIDDSTGLPGSASPHNESARELRRNAFDVDIPGTLATLDELGVN